MSFPSFDYLKSGLLGDDKAVMNYFRHFTAAEEFVMDDRSFEKWRKPMYSSIHVSKGCVSKCTLLNFLKYKKSLQFLAGFFLLFVN